MSEEIVATPVVPIILIAKMHRTISDGNYGNDRYEVPVPIEWTPGQPLEPLWEQAFAAARAQIEKEASYDQRLRDLGNQYRYSRGQTVQEWDNLIAQFQDDPTLQARHREFFIQKFVQYRAERVEQEEKDRMEKTRLAAIALSVIKTTRDYVTSNPVPAPETLWEGIADGHIPPYYKGLHEVWRTEVKSYADLPHQVRNALLYGSIDGIVTVELEAIMRGDIPKRERPADAPLPPTPPPFDNEEEEWDEDDEDPRREDDDC